MWKLLGPLLFTSGVLSAVQPNLMTRGVTQYASPALGAGRPVGQAGFGQGVRSAYSQPQQSAYAQQQLQLDSPLLKNYQDAVQQAVELPVPESVVGKEGGEVQGVVAAPSPYVLSSPYSQGSPSQYIQASPYAQEGPSSPYAQLGGVSSPYAQVGGSSSPYAQAGGLPSPYAQVGGPSTSPYAQAGPYSEQEADDPSPYAQSGPSPYAQVLQGSGRPAGSYRGVYPGISGPPSVSAYPFAFGPSAAGGLSQPPRSSPYVLNQPVHVLGAGSGLKSHRGVTKGVPVKTSTKHSSEGEPSIIGFGGGSDGRYNIEELEEGGPVPQGGRGPSYNFQGLGPNEFSPYSVGPMIYSMGGAGGPPPPHHHQLSYSPESGPPPPSHSFGGPSPYRPVGGRGPTFLSEAPPEYVAKSSRHRQPSFAFPPLHRRPRHGYMESRPGPPSHEFDY